MFEERQFIQQEFDEIKSSIQIQLNAEMEKSEKHYRMFFEANRKLEDTKFQNDSIKADRDNLLNELAHKDLTHDKAYISIR